MKVSIIVPVFNEGKTVGLILDKVASAKLPPGFTKEIIVINDGSTDNTTNVLRASKITFKTVNHPVNRGKGAAVKTGISQSRGDVVLIQDADMEYNPEDFVRLLQPFLDKRTTAVYGSRFIDYPLKLFGKNKTPLPFHWLANKGLTFLVNLLYGNFVTDMETCYKVIRRDTLVLLDLQANKFDIEPEITAKILKKGIKIIEVPIKVKPRNYDQGKKIGWKDGIAAIWTLFKYRFVN